MLRREQEGQDSKTQSSYRPTNQLFRMKSRFTQSSLRLITFLFSILCLSLILFPSSTLAQRSKKPSSSSATPDDFLPKYISQASKNDGILEISSPQEFQKLIAAPRSYSVSTLLTATKGPIKCQPCDNFAPEFKAVAKSWNRSKHNTRHVFAKLEFQDNQQVFQSVSREVVE